MRTTITRFLFLSLITCGLVIAACSTQQVEKVQAEVDTLQANLATQRADLEFILKNPVSTAEQIKKAQEQDAKLAKLEAQVAEAEKKLQSAVGPDGSINTTGALGAISTVLPPPWNALVPFFGGLGGILVQELRVRARTKDAVSIIKSIDKAMQVSSQVNSGLKALEGVERSEVREVLTPKAKELISTHSET